MEIRSPQSPQEWEAYFDLRYRLLREPWGQARGSERNEGDALAKHYALYDENQLLAVGRMDEQENRWVQIRFFAVETYCQGKGIGNLLMKQLINDARINGIVGITLQARENAVNFYQKLGFQVVQKTHILFGEIQHFEMELLLNNLESR